MAKRPITVRRRAQRVVIGKKNPIETPHYEPADGFAIKALHAGTASPEQQRRALDFIIYVLAGKDDQSFRPDESQYLTTFMEGRRFVGLQLDKLIGLPSQYLSRENTEDGS